MKPSYLLKLDRADEHLKQIRTLLAPYKQPRPYTVCHSVERKSKTHVYRIYPAEEPDLWIAIVLGDFLFDLRSALDHLRVALVPRNRRYRGAFPMFTEDIWERYQDTRRYVERTADARRFWYESVRGMSKDAIDQIDKIQPFRFPKADIPHLTLTILNRLNNADKHRELVPVANFLNPETVIAHMPEGPQTYTFPSGRDSVGGPGAVVLRLDREVQVEARGALNVTVGAGQHAEGGYRLPETCDTMLGYVRDGIVPLLEPFILTPGSAH